MPIRPENRARYPKDWKQIRARILERAGNRCEGSPAYPECRAINGYEIKGSEFGRSGRQCVVLTIAHLGRAAHLPVNLHVARSAKAGEVFEIIGLLVRSGPELPEWHHMMHRRALAEFRRMAPAVSAPFFIALPRFFSSRSPRRPVILQPAPVAPEVVRLTDWRLFGPPFEAARIAAEATAFFDVEATDGEFLAAPFAEHLRQAALGSTDGFVATARRASLDAISRLLGSDWKNDCADNALTFGRAFAWSGHAALYHADDYPENCADENLRAWCQRCHNTYDAPMRRAGIKARARAKLVIGDLL